MRRRFAYTGSSLVHKRPPVTRIPPSTATLPGKPLPRSPIARRLLAWMLGGGLSLLLGSALLWGEHHFAADREARQTLARSLAAAVAGDIRPADLERIWSAADEVSAPFRRVRDRLRAQAPGKTLLIWREGQAQAMLVVHSALVNAPPPGHVIDLPSTPGDLQPVAWQGRTGLLLPLLPGYRLMWLDDFPGRLAWWRQTLAERRLGLFALLLGLLALGWWQRRWYGQPLAGIEMGLSRVLMRPDSGPVRQPETPALRPMVRNINTLLEQVQERNRLRRTLDRYLSRAVVQQMSQDEQFAQLRSDKQVVTVLFADLFQFTQLTADLAPERVVEILNACFGVLSEAVNAQNGMVDKFLGDGLMAVFGAPDQDPEHAVKAVRAALDMQAALATLRRDVGLPELRVGIGINTGPAIVGNVGSEEHLDYTAIGNVVNLAARLEDFTRGLGAAIVVGSETMQRMGEEFVTERIDGVKLKGVRELLTIFRVHGRVQDEEADQSSSSTR